MQSNLDMALSYISRGWPVFPLHYMVGEKCSCGTDLCKDAAKHPLTSHGFKDATLDRDQAKIWWNVHPQANIGVEVGVRSGLCVLDKDPRNGGNESFNMLVNKYGTLPITAVVETGGGGEHYLFAYDADFAIPSEFRKGIDIKKNGYIVAVGSVHKSRKTYQWKKGASIHEVPLAPVPSFLKIRKNCVVDGLCAPGNSMEHLKKLSGASELKNEEISFQANTDGTHQIKINGSSIGAWIDQNGYIGSHTNGGPTVLQWVQYYGYSLVDAWKIIRKYDIALTKEDVVDDVDVVDTLSSKIFPITIFPLEVLPESLRILCSRASIAYSVPDGVVATILLTLTSSVIGNSVRVSPKPDWKEPVFLWSIIVGESGSGKSPVLNKFMEALKHLEKEERYKYRIALDEWNLEQIKYKSEQKKDKLPSPEPVMSRLIVNDTTVEALSITMRNSPRGVLVHQDELAGFIKAQGQYKRGGNDQERYLELWDCKSWAIDRSVRGCSYVPNTGCSIIGGIQPGILSKVFNEDSFFNGLFPRFLITHIPKGLYNTSKFSLNQGDEDLWREIIRRLYRSDLQQDSYGYNDSHILAYSPEGLDHFNKFRERTLSLGNYTTNRIKGFLPKIIAYAVRISGILHLLKDSKDVQVSLETIEDGIKVANYYIGQCVYIIENYGKKQEDDILESRLPFILNGMRGVIKNNKIPIAAIADVVNRPLLTEYHLSHQAIGIILRNAGLNTKISGGYSSLICDQRFFKMIDIYQKTSTSSTVSTIMPSYPKGSIPESEF